MSPMAVATSTLACIAAGAWLGSRLGTVLPPGHLDKDAGELVKLLSRLVSILVAMVLGLLVGSTKATYDAANDSMVHAGSKFVAIDRHLRLYGPEADPLREDLRRVLSDAVARGCLIDDARLIEGLERLHAAILKLAPASDDSARVATRDESRTLTDELLQSQWILDRQSEHRLPAAFVAGLIAWLVVLFAGFGLFSPRTATAAAAILVCAASISGAVFLILELGHPFHGLIRVSYAPFDEALTLMGR